LLISYCRYISSVKDDNLLRGHKTVENQGFPKFCLLMEGSGSYEQILDPEFRGKKTLGETQKIDKVWDKKKLTEGSM
jgi:hypothetical protein